MSSLKIFYKCFSLIFIEHHRPKKKKYVNECPFNLVLYDTFLISEMNLITVV